MVAYSASGDLEPGAAAVSLDGLPFLVLVVVLTVVAVLAAAAWLPRTRRSVRGFAARVATLLGVSALVLLSAAVVANNSFHFYADWGDLLGTTPVTTQTTQGGASPAEALGRATTGGASAPAATRSAPTSLPALPAPGQRRQSYVVQGPSSQLTGRLLVSLPPGYEDPANAGRTYPVIEAFHGFPGTPDVWMEGVNLVPSLDALAARRGIQDVIVVAPQLEFPPGTDTECVNGGAGRPQVEAFVGTDVPSFVAAHLRVRTDRASWATIGFSSGGWCAAMTTMLHPDVFGGAVVLGGYFTPAFGSAYRPFSPGDPAARRYDLVQLARSAPPPVALWVETSAADGLSYSTSAAVLAGARPPLSVQSRVQVGAGHRMSVWTAAVPDALAWLGSTMTGFRV